MTSSECRTAIGALLIVVAGLLACKQGADSQDGEDTYESIQHKPARSEADEHAKAGLEAWDRGDWDEAVTQLEKASAGKLVSYEQIEILTVLGAAYQRAKKLDQAQATLERALKLDPKSSRAWTYLGITHRVKGEHAKARECYEKALELNPKNNEALSSYGSLLILEDRPKEAIAKFERAIELDPSLAVSHGNLALALAMDGQFDAAEAALKRAAARGYPPANVKSVRERIEALKTAR